MAEQNYTVISDHKRKAEVWAHFELVLLTDGQKRARCKRCGDLLKHESNTTLKRHHEGSCSGLKNVTDPNQPMLDNSGQIWTYDDALARELQMKCVIQMGLPFGHFDNTIITNMIRKGLQPRYNPVSRQTLRRDAIKYWLKAKKSIKEMFLNLPSNVSLTADIWSAPMGLPQTYICITAHWIMPDSWQLMKRVIAFQNFGSPHSGARQYSLIMKTLKHFNLTNKIISMSFDNASNNTACIDKLRLSLSPILNGKLFHTRCCAHIINLAVQDGLKQINFVLKKFRLMLRRIFTKGPKMQNLYIEYCGTVGFTPLSPAHDMPVRWNSTWKMMDNLLRQRAHIHAFYNYHYSENNLNDYDWQMLTRFHDLLTEFKTATTLLSGVYYPTTPLVLNQIFILATKLAQYEDDDTFDFVVEPMKIKLLKYFKDVPFTFLVAAALNPYLNKIGVEYMIGQICLAFGLDTARDKNESMNRVLQFNNDFHQLYEIYRVKYGGGSQQTETSQMFSPGSSRGQSRTDIMANLMQSVAAETGKKARFDGNTMGEYNQYTNTNFLAAASTTITSFESIDLLDWWKIKQSTYPIMSMIARDILTIQASTVASESAFSLSGRIISARRSRLTAQSVECCVCLKDFLDGEDRIQDRTNLEDDLPGVEDNIAENEENEGLAPPIVETDVSDSSTVSRYSDEEEDVVDKVNDDTAVDRLTKYNSLDEYNPEMAPNYVPYYNPNNYDFNPWLLSYESSQAGGSGAGGSQAEGSGAGGSQAGGSQAGGSGQGGWESGTWEEGY